MMAFFGFGKNEEPAKPAQPGSKLTQYTTQQNYSSTAQQERMGKGLDVTGITGPKNLESTNNSGNRTQSSITELAQNKSKVSGGIGGSRRRKRRKSIRRKKRFV
jgi:hypothetical protein